jgi:prepilin-type N-terminal cleavage/methylation domain-containing protein
MKLFKPNKQRVKYNQGFTLVELMVALTLFVFAVLAAISSLYTVNNSSRKVNASRAVFDNLSFAVESMSRNIRTGEKIICGTTPSVDNNCQFGGATGSTTLSFTSTLGTKQDIQYSLCTSGSCANQIIKKVKPTTSSSWPSGYVVLTADEIKVQSLLFFVDGANANDDTQPNVMIFMRGVTTDPGGTTAPFSIQTYVSQRTLE